MTNVEMIPLQTSKLPPWAERYLRENLDDDVEVVNANLIEHGPMKNAVLVNTTEGCALLSRHRFGEPTLVRLPLPGRRFSFACVDCKEQIELMDADTPRPFFCTRCARHYTLSRENDTYVLFTAMDHAAPEKKPRGPGWTRVDPDGPRPVAKTPPKKQPRKQSRTKYRKQTQKHTQKPSQKTAPRKTGPFRYKGYTLQTRQVDLKNGRAQRIYYFSKKSSPDATPSAKPRGYQVSVTKTGMPVLRKSGNGAVPAHAGASKKGKKTGPRCQARTEDGRPCHNTSRHGSKYCASHHGYRPRGAPTPSKNGGKRKKEKQYEAQCQAVTEAGKQCRNSSREKSKYCIAHFGYRPPRLADTARRGTNTKPRVKKAEDTRPSYRHRSKKNRSKRRVLHPV